MQVQTGKNSFFVSFPTQDLFPQAVHVAERPKAKPFFTSSSGRYSSYFGLHGELNKKRAGGIQIPQAEAVGAFDFQEPLHGQEGVRPPQGSRHHMLPPRLMSGLSAAPE